MGKVVHFEIPADDPVRAGNFYNKLFGWNIEPVQNMQYWIARTVEVDSKMIPKEVGAINGGIFKRGGTSAQHPVLVIDVESIDQSLKDIQKAGGSVFVPKQEIGGMGFYATFRDCEGNVMGLWENIKKN
ncbi:MAG: VOC family protein [Candidatus Aenigmarchaeota archaeon]|nr:VOC family protein [Candidatus Aenigmarchaeota archaeon]